jgi:hypothetical protein
MPLFEVEKLGGGKQRLICNAGETAVEADAAEQGGGTRTAWQYERYEVEDFCLQTAERMAANADVWRAYIMSRDKEIAADAVRAERDKLLAGCDWTVAVDAKTDKTAWQAYRQALRDVPKQVGFPYAADWPVCPGN